MIRRRGAALVLALVVLLAATAASAMALQWAVLQLQLGRAWREALQADVASQAAAVRLLQAGAGWGGHAHWALGDSLILVRMGSDATGGVVELLLRGSPSPQADSLPWRLVAPYGLLPLP